MTSRRGLFGLLLGLVGVRSIPANAWVKAPPASIPDTVFVYGLPSWAPANGQINKFYAKHIGNALLKGNEPYPGFREKVRRMMQEEGA